MAKIDSPELNNFLLNPASINPGKTETKKAQTKPIVSGRKARFSTLLEKAQAEAASELGPLLDLPVSEETVNQLMDEVRSAGGSLQERPFPEEIIRYKRAVRNFMYYVVENGYKVNATEGIPKFLKPNYKGPRGTEESRQRQPYITVQVIDKKLEDMAAMILGSQINQIELASRLEEITGLLVDLIQ
jgi:uncharacterized protein YaaR (DUF327 family)